MKVKGRRVKSLGVEMKEGEKDCDEIAIREFCTGKEMKMIYIRRVELCEELHSFTEIGRAHV